MSIKNIGAKAMSSPFVLDYLGRVPEHVQLQEILHMNDESEKYGLILTAEDAHEIIDARVLALQNYGRVELDLGATRQLISSFCSSPSISQEDYAAILKDLLELFYYLKNETEDLIGDAELIKKMKDCLDGSCEGSLKMFKGVGIENLIKDFKQKKQQEDLLKGAD
jgi:hypothetical protein